MRTPITPNAPPYVPVSPAAFRPVTVPRLVAVLVLAHAASAGPVRAAGPFGLRSGDRVVLLGNTFVERMVKWNYLETLLTRDSPGDDIIFRNLGWSGDDVFGHSRAGFDPPEAGFGKLEEQLVAQKPSVVLVGYGMNESFEGEAGLPRFREGLERLLDAIAKTGARVAVISPIRHERLPPPLPDPTEHNRRLELYVRALASAADRRGYPFVDLFHGLDAGPAGLPLTDNGIHLTAYGYWRAALEIERRLSLRPPDWLVEASVSAGGKRTAVGAAVSPLPSPQEPGGVVLRLRVTDDVLPAPPAPDAFGGRAGGTAAAAAGLRPSRTFRVRGLAPGRYTLRIDGEDVITATAAAWARGVEILAGPDVRQVEELRAVIARKSFLFFGRWRPHNTTYLFGFRKHEQGRNAVEVAKLDPLIAREEKRIAELRRPLPHTYEIVAAGKEAR